MYAWRLVVVLVVVGWLPGAIQAQQPFQKKGQFSMSVSMLLGSPDVQKELKLTAEQTKQIEQLMQKQMEKAMELFTQAPEKIMGAIQEMAKESDKAALKMLQPGQIKRLNELKVQANGTRNFRDPSLLAYLEVSDEQETQINDLLAEMEKAAPKFKGRPKSAEDFQEMSKLMKTMKDLDRRTLESILGVLTADQRALWQQQVGKAFTGSLMPTMPAGGFPPFGKK